MGTSERQLFRARFGVVVYVVAVATCTVVIFLMSTWWFCPHPSSTDSCGESVGRPRRLHPSACTRYCSLETDVALASWICSPWQPVALGLSVHVTVQLGLLSLGMQTPPGAVMVDATEPTRGDLVWTASVESPSFHAGSLVTVIPVKYFVLSLTHFVSERLRCCLVLCACWHDGI